MTMEFFKQKPAQKALAVCLTMALCVGSIAVGAFATEAPQTKPVASTAVKADASTPEGALELAMRAVKALDIDALCRYSNNRKVANFHSLYSGGESWGSQIPVLFGGENPKNDALYQELVRSLTWKMEAPAISGETATIVLETTNRDFSGVMAEIVSQALLDAADLEIQTSRDKATDAMVLLTKAVSDSQTITLSLTAEMRRADGVWKLQINDAFANAVCGNLLDGIKSKESKAQIDAASQTLEETIKNSIDWENLNQEWKDAIKGLDEEIVQQVRETMKEVDFDQLMKDAIKEIDFEKTMQEVMGEVDFPKELKDAMDEYDFEKELQDAMDEIDFSKEVEHAVKDIFG